jgi:hypothetical protein
MEALSKGDKVEEVSSDDEDVSDDEWSPWGCLASLFSLFGVLMPKGEK